MVDEANAFNMFGGACGLLIQIRRKSSILPALEFMAQSPPAHCIIVIEAGELKRDAPLRKWIESQSFAASVECRADEVKDIQRLIDARSSRKHLDRARRARSSRSHAGRRRLSTRSELDKLALYAHGQKR